MLHLIFRPDIVRRSLIIAVIVGAILNIINQGDAFLSEKEVNWFKIGLTFLVPYCVSTYGAVTALMKR